MKLELFGLYFLKSFEDINIFENEMYLREERVIRKNIDIYIVKKDGKPKKAKSPKLLLDNSNPSEMLKSIIYVKNSHDGVQIFDFIPFINWTRLSYRL